MSHRPNPEIIVSRASEEETAAVVAAVQQFVRDAAPVTAPMAAEPPLNAWKQAALLEGISRQPNQ
jgi:hypothetical protein